MTSNILSEYMSPAECAEELGVCRRTLERWRRLGEGPRLTKMGRRILYRKAAVAEWLRSREQDAA